MQNLSLHTSLEYIKGIGPERAKLLRSVLGVTTLEDLLHLYPLRYEDRSRVYRISELSDQSGDVQIEGKILDLKELSSPGGKRLRARFEESGNSLELVWFSYPKWLVGQIPIGKTVRIFGKVSSFQSSLSMAHPEIELPTTDTKEKGLLPVYPSSEKLTKRGITQKLMRTVLKNILSSSALPLEENLPHYLLEKTQMLSRVEAYRQVHFPSSALALEKANHRLKFEESFFFQLGYLLKKNHQHQYSKGHPMKRVGEYFHTFYSKHLPFPLTSAQKKVLKEIQKDMKKPVQMNRLLQGDVGSGKTIVALLSMLLAMDNGFQCCLMAPTEILAQQHYKGISTLLEPMGIRVEILTGSSKTRQRREVLQGLENGDISVLIGTHALLEDPVVFQNLGLAIIDEQHRFGVAQRARLYKKNTTAPHILIMTATPIPRTLAMSFYSDLDVSVIDELPVGRKAIITAHRREKDRLSVYKFCREQLEQGRQLYFVYPLIEESQMLDYKNLQEGYQQVESFFKSYRAVMLHGKMPSEDKQEAMKVFAQGKAQIMVSTTVIEVGVNVPNASVMVIESAERFGLSQLHQLRGRVGRGSSQSYCILMSKDKLSSDSRTRLRTMVDTTDGFKISEVDMQLRGPGDIMGTQQSGLLDFKKLDLLSDSELIATTKQWAQYLLTLDPTLTDPRHLALRNYYVKSYRGKNKWMKIS